MLVVPSTTKDFLVQKGGYWRGGLIERGANAEISKIYFAVEQSVY